MLSPAVFVQNVEKILAKLEWSQAEFARRLGVSQPGISRLLSGNTTPSLETIDKFAAVLGVPPHELITDDANPNAVPPLVIEVDLEEALSTANQRLLERIWHLEDTVEKYESRILELEIAVLNRRDPNEYG